MNFPQVIIFGDSTFNTLGVIRSLGKAGKDFFLILYTDDDYCDVLKSRYVNKGRAYKTHDFEEVGRFLDEAETGCVRPVLICTFDAAAEYIDINEPHLCSKFITPCRGKRIGNLFNKEKQCLLATECGLTVPATQVFRRSDVDRLSNVSYPCLIKPLISTGGEKGDIHICQSAKDLNDALTAQSDCTEFVMQEYIHKEYELDCMGVVTEDEIIIPGAIRKIRHYPEETGAGAFAVYVPARRLNIDFSPLYEFLKRSNYHGVFSAEFLHTKDGKNYFMEVNFRNDGLAWAPTCAGANLPLIYADSNHKYDEAEVRKIYMMNYGIDYLYVKNGKVSKLSWWKDFLRTRCYINASFHDPMPTLAHYLRKLGLA